MSSRITYANGGAGLAEFIVECWQNLPSKFDENGKAISPEEATIDFIAAWICGMDRDDPEPGEKLGRGSVLGLCTAYCLNWPVLAGWIRKDPTRNARFGQGMQDRGMLRKEWLMDGWIKTAKIAVPDTAASHGDVHKAREAIAKSEGVFSDKQDVAITVKYVAEVPEVEPDAETWAKKYAPLPVIAP